MQPAGLLEESVVPLGAEETIVTTDQTEVTPVRHVISNRVVGNGNVQDLPPVITRYESSGGNYSGRNISRVLSPASRAGVLHTTSTSSRSTAQGSAGKLLMVRRSDGTTQFLRQIPQGEESVSQHLMRTRNLQSVRTVPGSRMVQVSSREQEPTSTRLVAAHAVEPTAVRTGYEQTVDPFMKRMAMEKAVSGSATTTQGLVRRQITRPAETYEEVYYEPSDGKEHIVYTDGVRPVVSRPVSRVAQPYGYGQNPVITRSGPRSTNVVIGGRSQPNVNAQRVYYVKNTVAMVPSRVVLAPAESYVQEEIVYDNGDYVIDGGEISNNSDTHMA
ncbi:K167R repeat protein [Oesophagostomum dentatum]|uniref:K167R repeat protein n=1 Tax=Oesophagostomum dentatum TaxID=61180 RepID=A0A0B1TD35_OESDE|nr:K167R repeat protein [Oesophagostomum dentatum]